MDSGIVRGEDAGFEAGPGWRAACWLGLRRPGRIGDTARAPSRFRPCYLGVIKPPNLSLSLSEVLGNRVEYASRYFNPAPVL